MFSLKNDFKEENFVKVDPWDKRRYLTQAEHMLEAVGFGTFGVHTVDCDVSLKSMEDALDKYYEWYPVVGLGVKLDSNGICYFSNGSIRPTTFVEDVKNNMVIRNYDDYCKVLEKTYNDYFTEEKYTFGPRMYKIDVSTTNYDPVFGEKKGYLMTVPVDHVLFAGGSHKTVANFINGWMSNKNYKPRLSGPQECVNSVYPFVTEKDEVRTIENPHFGPIDYIGLEENSKIDKFKRGLVINVRRINRSDLQRPEGCSLTVAMSSIQAFIFTSLLLDYHSEKEAVGQPFTCPYKVDHSRFGNIMEGDEDDMIGNYIITSRIYQQTSRSAPKSLYQMIETAKIYQGIARKNAEQSIINGRHDVYLKFEDAFRKEFINSLVSNIGNEKLSKGPINSMLAYAHGAHAIGSINFVTIGQPDGTILLCTMSHKTSYCHNFVKLYGDLFLRVGQLSRRRDVTRAELIQMPEYKELLTYIKK